MPRGERERLMERRRGARSELVVEATTERLPQLQQQFSVDVRFVSSLTVWNSERVSALSDIDAS